MIRPISQAVPQFRPLPGLSNWAIEWPRIKLWAGQALGMSSVIQEWATGIRVTAWVQPSGRIAVLGDKVDDDFEYTYRFPHFVNHPWYKMIQDRIPPKSAVEGILMVPGFSRRVAAEARKSGNDFQIWSVGLPYYDGNSLLWESPTAGLSKLSSLEFPTMFAIPVKRMVQFQRLSTVADRRNYLEKEALEMGIEGWVLKHDQGGSRAYLVKPFVSVFGKVVEWTYSSGGYIRSIVVSMDRFKLEVTKFPPDMPQLLAEMDNINVLRGRKVEVRAERIEPDGTLINPKFHRFAGKATREMMSVANFVTKFKVKPKVSKWKSRLLKDIGS